MHARNVLFFLRFHKILCLSGRCFRLYHFFSFWICSTSTIKGWQCPNTTPRNDSCFSSLSCIAPNLPAQQSEERCTVGLKSACGRLVHILEVLAYSSLQTLKTNYVHNVHRHPCNLHQIDCIPCSRRLDHHHLHKLYQSEHVPGSNLPWRLPLMEAGCQCKTPNWAFCYKYPTVKALSPRTVWVPLMPLPRLSLLRSVRIQSPL